VDEVEMVLATIVQVRVGGSQVVGVEQEVTDMMDKKHLTLAVAMEVKVG
tara:strand:- start:512 stop:658 length:147 start_codon:yes stop_codon:yes gene_type:complete